MASSAWLTWSRPCASVMKASLRSAVHLIGRPSFAGAQVDDRFLGVVEDLRAEAAADIGRNDAQLVLRQMQDKGAHQKPDDMRILAGRVERVIAGCRGRYSPIAARGSIALGIRRLLTRSILVTCGPWRRRRRRRPCRRDASRSRGCSWPGVMHLRRAGLGGRGGIDDGRQLLIVDLRSARRHRAPGRVSRR